MKAIKMDDIDEWNDRRCGKITASRMSDVLAKGEGVSRARYCAELASARMTGKPHRSTFSSDAIDHGVAFESVARMMYEIKNGVMVEGDGKTFIDHPFVKNSGMSPDGLVNDDGMVEIKCPSTHVFIGYKLSGEIPRAYRLQMTWQCAVMRRKWCDFVAYDPDLPEEDGFIQIRFIPTEDEIKNLEFEVIKFDMEVEDLIKKLIEKRTT